jgi:hypothetical protein
MKRELFRSFSGIALLSVLMFLGFSCGETVDSPKEVVVKMFGAMDRDDIAALNDVLDIPALMETGTQDYSLQADTARVFHNPEDLLNDLTGDGKTKQRWFSYQRVMGNTEIKDDTAFVEISFIDKAKSTQYYNKFGLHKDKSGRWMIYSFRTVSRE